MCKLRGNKKKQGNKVTGFNNNHTKSQRTLASTQKNQNNYTSNKHNQWHTQKKIKINTLATTPNYKAQP
jgi:hypothetical protein